MDYLKQHNRASAPALLVISRYLATQHQGESEGDLQKALRPHGIAPDEDRPPQINDVLTASLRVGQNLDLFDGQGTARGRRVWSLRDSLRNEIQAVWPADSRPFRALLLRHFSARAVQDVEAGQHPSDVVRALVWLLHQDPLAPFSASWGDGPEKAFDTAGLKDSVANSEQWRALLRWMKSLGLGTLTAVGSGRNKILIADPTLAIQDTLHELPRRETAARWFRSLYAHLSILGDPKLVSELPAGSVSSQDVTASVALAVQKLERGGRLRLVPSDDASNAIVLRLGRQARRIGEVHVIKENS